MSIIRKARATRAGKSTRRYMNIPDMHHPHVDPVWEAIVIKAAEIICPDEIIVGGDGIDAEAASSHPKSTFAELADVRRVTEEYASLSAWMKRMHRAAGGCDWVYIEGNHEHRVERECLKLSSQFGRDVFDALSPKVNICREAPAKMKWIDYASDTINVYRIAEDLVACHGWSFAKRAVQVHLEKARGVSIWFNHVHREAHESGTDLDGRVIEGWSVGSGCKKQPYWQHGKPNDWVLGFGVTYVGRDSWTQTTHVIKPTRSGGGSVVLDGGMEIIV